MSMRRLTLNRWTGRLVPTIQGKQALLRLTLLPTAAPIARLGSRRPAVKFVERIGTSGFRCTPGSLFVVRFEEVATGSRQRSKQN